MVIIDQIWSYLQFQPSYASLLRAFESEVQRAHSKLAALRHNNRLPLKFGYQVSTNLLQPENGIHFDKDIPKSLLGCMAP